MQLLRLLLLTLVARAVAAACGDGVMDVGETCDDGNTDNLDGCDASCDVEAGHVCVSEPSQCAQTCATNGGVLTMGSTVTLTSAVEADALLADCTEVTSGLTFDFVADTTFGPHPLLTKVWQITVDGTLTDNLCAIFPSLEEINYRLTLNVGAVHDCPGISYVGWLLQQTGGSLIETLRLPNANVPTIWIRAQTQLTEVVIGSECTLSSTSEHCILRDVKQVFLQSWASGLYPAGGIDLTVYLRHLHDDDQRVHNGAGVRTARFVVPRASTTNVIYYVTSEILETLIIENQGTGRVSVLATSAASLKVVSVKTAAFERLADGVSLDLTGAAALETLALPPAAGEDLVVALHPSVTQLCCKDLNHPRLEEWTRFVQCSNETCDSCGGNADLVGSWCSVCQCDEAECFRMGQRSGSATVCTSDAYSVSAEARPSLCLEGQSMSDVGVMTGDSVVVRGTLVVKEKLVLTPTVLGVCSSLKEGQLSVDVVTGMMHECHLGEWAMI